MRLGSTDGASVQVYCSLSEMDGDEDTNRQAFAVLCGGAAVAATRYADEHDLGMSLTPQERARWQGIRDLLMHLSDAHSFGAEGGLEEVREALEGASDAFR